jgi:hypothetical protein
VKPLDSDCVFSSHHSLRRFLARSIIPCQSFRFKSLTLSYPQSSPFTTSSGSDPYPKSRMFFTTDLLLLAEIITACPSSLFRELCTLVSDNSFRRWYFFPCHSRRSGCEPDENSVQAWELVRRNGEVCCRLLAEQQGLTHYYYSTAGTLESLSRMMPK